MAFYERFLDTVVPVSSTRTAEMTKLLENIFRCVNIALMNELLLVSERMGINIWEVVDAAKTKPFGFMPFYPGPGLGGHCIPIDPFYLSWKARQFDMHTEFIELAGKTNEAMPYYVVERLASALNTHRKPLAGSRVLILGIAYKANIDDMRESPAIKIAELLLVKEADVIYHDPFVSEFSVGGVGIPQVELTAESLAEVDAVVVVTDHSNVDYELGRLGRASSSSTPETRSRPLTTIRWCVSSMTAYIHPTALVNPGFTPAPFTIIDEGAAIFADVKIGSFVRVHAGARIHEGCVIGDHVTVGAGVELHDGVVVSDFAFVGKEPDRWSDSEADSELPTGASIGAGSTDRQSRCHSARRCPRGRGVKSATTPESPRSAFSETTFGSSGG